MAAEAETKGATVRTSVEVVDIVRRDDEVVLRGGSGEEVVGDRVVLCSGLHVDRLARLAGDVDGPRIGPLRGEYLVLRPELRHLARGLIRCPTRGTRSCGCTSPPRVDGEVLVGPNAVLALAREGYRRRDVSPADLREIGGFGGFRRFARSHWRTGIAEMRGSCSRRVFLAAARRYVPGADHRRRPARA